VTGLPEHEHSPFIAAWARSWDDKQPTFRPIRHAWRVEVAHGRLGRCRRLTKSFENTTTSATGWLQVACIATTLRHLSRERARRHPAALAA
jgi:putative transposase